MFYIALGKRIAYNKVSRTAWLYQHRHQMIENNIERDDDSNGGPQHSEPNAESLAQHLAYDCEENIRMPPHQIVKSNAETRTRDSDRLAKKLFRWSTHSVEEPVNAPFEIVRRLRHF